MYTVMEIGKETLWHAKAQIGAADILPHTMQTHRSTCGDIHCKHKTQMDIQKSARPQKQQSKRADRYRETHRSQANVKADTNKTQQYGDVHGVIKS